MRKHIQIVHQRHLHKKHLHRYINHRGLMTISHMLRRHSTHHGTGSRYRHSCHSSGGSLKHKHSHSHSHHSHKKPLHFKSLF